MNWFQKICLKLSGQERELLKSKKVIQNYASTHDMVNAEATKIYEENQSLKVEIEYFQNRIKTLKTVQKVLQFRNTVSKRMQYDLLPMRDLEKMQNFWTDGDAVQHETFLNTEHGRRLTEFMELFESITCRNSMESSGAGSTHYAAGIRAAVSCLLYTLTHRTANSAEDIDQYEVEGTPISEIIKQQYE